MELNRELWAEEAGEKFTKYLESLKRSDKIEWTKKIINTNMDVLAIKSPDILNITKQIKKGNYLSFLDLNLNKYYENTAVNGSAAYLSSLTVM